MVDCLVTQDSVGSVSGCLLGPLGFVGLGVAVLLLVDEGRVRVHNYPKHGALHRCRGAMTLTIRHIRVADRQVKTSQQWFQLGTPL